MHCLLEVWQKAESYVVWIEHEYCQCDGVHLSEIAPLTIPLCEGTGSSDSGGPYKRLRLPLLFETAPLILQQQ